MTTDAHSKAGAYGAVAAALIAAIALSFTYWQIQVSQRVQREASARDAFKEYLKLAMEKPDLADARLATATKTESGRSGYAWFVSYFLFSGEQVYLAFQDDTGWRNALADQFCYHKVYLGGAEFQKKLKLHYDPSFTSFLDQSLKQCAN